MSRPVILDLFCGAGGAGRGYQDAGFEVVGVDIHPQPRYPFHFTQDNALSFLDSLIALQSRPGFKLRYSAIHASPPCQAFSDLQKQNKRVYEDFIPPVRARLQALGLPYIIENVEGAPLRRPTMLCGTMFPELRVIRHRLFESTVPLTPPRHPRRHPLVFTHDRRKAHYGRLDQNTAFVQVTGGGNCTVANAQDAMGIDWMTKKEINEAIPPAYTRYLGRQLRRAVV